MRFVAGRGAVLEKLAGALMRMAGVFLAEMQLPYAPWRKVKHRPARTSTAAPGEPLAHRTAGRGTLLLFGWCAEGVHLVYYFHWDAEDSVQLFVCGGVVVAEEPYYCNELVVGYLTEWLVVSLV